MRNLFWSVPFLLFGVQICASAATILPGTDIMVRNDRSIDVHAWDRGRIYPAHVARNVFDGDGNLVIPSGSYAELIANQSGPDQMALDLEFVMIDGARYTVDTTGPKFGVPNTGIQRGVRFPPESTLTFRFNQPLDVF
jgi:hypothetical protein